MSNLWSLAVTMIIQPHFFNITTEKKNDIWKTAFLGYLCIMLKIKELQPESQKKLHSSELCWNLAKTPKLQVSKEHIFTVREESDSSKHCYPTSWKVGLGQQNRGQEMVTFFPPGNLHWWLRAPWPTGMQGFPREMQGFLGKHWPFQYWSMASLPRSIGEVSKVLKSQIIWKAKPASN